MQEDVALVKRFDGDGNGWLNTEERKAAREAWLAERGERRGPGPGPGPGGGGGWGGPGGGRGPQGPGGGGGPGGFGGRGGESMEPVKAGVALKEEDVILYPGVPIYEPTVIRTLFFTFETDEWEKELEDFNHTDVEVPATLRVDGREYAGVGVRFRGASSLFTVGEGRKRSLNVSLDLVDSKQRLGGYRTLNLLNAHTDPTYLRSVLYLHVAGQYLPAPKANHVRVVINGENWGIFVNVQQINSDFTKEAFGSSKGARWKVPGSPRGQAGLNYIGDDPEAYRRLYEIKSKDTPESWAALMDLCRALDTTPAAELPAALATRLDVEGALRFLALDNVFINGDGYWIRASDYYLYRDERGMFHVLPYDTNETFRPPGGPGMRGGGGEGVQGVNLDPLTGVDREDRPLLHRLLAVPEWRARYLAVVREMAERWLDWENLGSVAGKHHAVLAADVERDTRKLYSMEAFKQGLDGEMPAAQVGRGPQQPAMSLKAFADARRAYLLGHPDVKGAK